MTIELKVFCRRYDIMKKKLLPTILALSMVFGLVSCGQKTDTSKSDKEKTEAAESTKKADSESKDTKTEDKNSEESKKKTETADTSSQELEQKKTEVQLFVDSDLEYVMNQLAKSYESTHSDVAISCNVDHSTSLLTQIEEGAACDLYFTGVESQMEQLQNSGWIISDGYTNVVGDTLAVITKKGSATVVTGLGDFANAGSIALAGGNLPVGGYTRRAMVVSGMITETDDLSAITASEISEQLNGVIIQEKDSTDQVLSAVMDGSCEVGCLLSSDLCGYEDSLDVVETLGNDYSGRIVYSLAQIKNDKASQEEIAAATAFMDYITGQEAAAIFSQCHYSTVQ